MEKSFELLPPTMPNFARFKQEAQLRQEGFKPAEVYDIANFSKEEAEEYAELMYRTFMEHWAERRKKQNNS